MGEGHERRERVSLPLLLLFQVPLHLAVPLLPFGWG